MRPERASAALYAVGVAALWPVPVFGLLHAESSAVLAAAGFFAAGMTSVSAFRGGERPGPVLLRQWGALAVPLAMLTLSLLWRPNCGYATGLALFALLVPPSVALGVASAYALTGLPIRAARTVLGIGGLLLAGIGTVVALRTHPQLFVYNAIYGGVLGPIYDDELAVRPGLVVARATALVAAAALFSAGHAARGGGARWRWAALGLGALVGVAGLGAGRLGMVQTQAGIERTLRTTVDLGVVRIHVDPRETTPVEVRRAVDEARFRYADLERQLGTAPRLPVDVYLYASPDVKGALVGSRVTSVTPVWLRTPQVHMLASEVERSLAHELAHVFAREFGLPGLGASPAVGLVEGLAVAVEPPDGAPAPGDLVAASAHLTGDLGALGGGPADAVRATMSPAGFWAARPGIAYTANGAFTAWLLDRYGAGPVRRVYRTGDWRGSFGASLDTLVTRWGRDVQARPVTAAAIAAAAWTFRQPSLFEAPCPHHVPSAVRRARVALDAQRAGAWRDAERVWHAAREAASPALRAATAAGWGRAALVAGTEPGRVATALRPVAALDSLDAGVRLALADALRLAGQATAADSAYAASGRMLAPYAVEARALGRQRAALPPRALRRWLALDLSAPDAARPLARALSRSESGPARVLGALALHRLGADDEAWRTAARWRIGTGADGAVGRLWQSRIAYGAGRWRTAERTATDAARRFRAGGQPDAAALAEDAARRARWARNSPSPTRRRPLASGS